jgi:hypothetical protein
MEFVIVEAAEKAFRTLDDTAIYGLLYSKNDQVRKAASLKCIRALPKSRLQGLLAGYLATDGARYYNVIHWLDLGLSIPVDRAHQAADRLITRTWRT